MDIKEFYPSITKKTLDDALNFARKHTEITDKEVRTILHCRKSLLFCNEEAWKKKDFHDCFDVTMGSFDGAEICELIGILILHNLPSIIAKQDVGLYRDDRLLVLKNSNTRFADTKRKNIIRVFKDIGFDIDININMKTVDFLDMTLDLVSETYKPYKKPNNYLQYIHTSSNHPENILKQLPISINERLSKNSSNENVFNRAKPEYEEALKNSGYENPNLTFTKKAVTNQHSRKRKRNIIWFNPPYSKNVSTDVARSFLKLIKKHFTKNNNLQKYFNKNNVKVSYSCTENVASIINAHNKKVLLKREVQASSCNCRNKTNCPLQGNCKTASVIYKCEVTAQDQPKKCYIGLTEHDFKKRFSGHKKILHQQEVQKQHNVINVYMDFERPEHHTIFEMVNC